jgi:hypothetical protein
MGLEGWSLAATFVCSLVTVCATLVLLRIIKGGM